MIECIPNFSEGRRPEVIDAIVKAISGVQGVAVLDHRGEEFTAENVGERLSVRDFMSDLRSSGVETGGPKAYSTRDKQAFASGLDRILTRALRSR